MNVNRRTILNVALATIAAATLSAGFTGCASDAPPENRRTTGEFTSDAALTAKVKSAIATDVGARTAAAINIETYRGVVQLTGFVGTPDQASKAEAAAKKVEGVTAVDNQLKVVKGS